MKPIVCLSILLLATLSEAIALDLEHIRSKYHLPALSIGKSLQGNITIQTTGTRKTADTILATNTDKWHLGSNGKAITATLAAILIEENFLSWQTKLPEIFPERNIHSKYRNITLRELFAHRAGITGNIIKFQDGKYWESFWDTSKDPTQLRNEFVKAVLTTKPSNDPNKFTYSNASYIVASSILNKVTGKSWEDLVQEKIFQPLEMLSCGFGAAGKESPEIATQPWPHLSVLGTPLKSISPAKLASDNPKALGPAGTIHCSIRDWLKFAQTHLNGFNGQNTKILSAAGFENLHKDYKNQGYTSGGFIYQKREGQVYLGHNGSNTMNFAILVLDPSNHAAYVSATNRGDRKHGQKGAQKAMQLIGSPDVCMQTSCLLTKN